MMISISGLANKRLLLSVFLLSLAGMVLAVDVNITLPHFTGSNPEIEVLNEELERAFGLYEDLLRSELAFLPSSFSNLPRAFANTSVFSSDGASQRGYEGYKTFSFTIGSMGAIQFPGKFTLLDEIKDIIINSGEGEIGFDFIRDNLDIGLGLDVQILNAQLGINTSKFLLKGLYLGFKFSMFDTNRIEAISSLGFSFKTMSAGITASYQLITQKRLLGGLFVWRGLNLGTGFIWQNTSLGLTTSILSESDLLNFSIGPISMQFDEIFHLRIDTNTFIIPIEAVTSIRLLGFLNAALGAGVDIAIGSSNINADGSFALGSYSGLPAGVIMDVTPSLNYSLGGKSAPGLFNLKVMGAVGFNFGPVIIDIPVTYYFLNNGYSLGFTLGFTL
jgi:hypothetical protein